MELINQTHLPAHLQVTTASDPALRAAVLTVKATLVIQPDGRLVYDDDQLPIWEQDEMSELGILPSDLDAPGPDAPFELCVLGAAYSDHPDRPITQRTVELRVGDRVNRLLVTGDRHCTRSSDGWVVSPPEPFTRMPLTWERAFGGTVDVWLDEDTFVPVSYPFNPTGRGFDPQEIVNGMVDRFGCREGYPKFESPRQMPNVERVDPTGEDAVAELWAPSSIGLLRQEDSLGISGPGTVTSSSEQTTASRRFSRAHSGLVWPEPISGQVVELRGVSHRAPSEKFVIPALELMAEIGSGGSRVMHSLRLHRALVLSDEHRLMILLGGYFRVVHDPHRVLSVRLILS